MLPLATQNPSWIINYILTRTYKRKAQSCIDIYIFCLNSLENVILLETIIGSLQFLPSYPNAYQEDMWLRML